MALEEFENEPLNEREKGLVRMRSITNYGMGVFLVVAGCFFMFPTIYTRKYISQYDPLVIKIFAIICFDIVLFKPVIIFSLYNTIGIGFIKKAVFPLVVNSDKYITESELIVYVFFSLCLVCSTKPFADRKCIRLHFFNGTFQFPFFEEMKFELDKRQHQRRNKNSENNWFPYVGFTAHI